MMKLPRFATLATLAVACAALPALAQERPWLHVQAQGDDDNTRLELNLPLAAVEVLGGALGEQILEEIERDRDHDTDLDLDSEDVRALWRSLRESAGTWVTIDEEDGANLRARMDGDQVRIEGGDDGASLDVRIPVAFGDALFGEEDDEPDLGAAIRALADYEDVLISLDGDDGQVRVWIGPR